MLNRLLTILLLITPLSALAGEPEKVFIGLKIDQITNINQKSENFGVVGTLRIKWHLERLPCN